MLGGLESTCWNSKIIRFAFIIDAFVDEIIAWTAVINAGISGSGMRDIMQEVVEKRFGATPNSACYRASLRQWFGLHSKEHEAVCPSPQLDACFTPVARSQSNGMSEALVKTLKRDYIRISALPGAETALRLIHGWIEDHNEIHSHSALKMNSPQ